MEKKDNYLKWLKEKREQIKKIEDKDIKKIYLEMHDMYAEKYILTR